MQVSFEVSKWQFDEMTGVALHYGFDSLDDWMASIFTKVFNDNVVERKLLAAARAASLANSLIKKPEEKKPENVYSIADHIIKKMEDEDKK